MVLTQRQTGTLGLALACSIAFSTKRYTDCKSCPLGTEITFQPSAPNAEKDRCMLKESFVIRPESLVSLSERTRTNGLTRSFAANPGIAANASLASPSIEAPSETVQIVTRSRFATLS